MGLLPGGHCVVRHQAPFPQTGAAHSAPHAWNPSGVGAAVAASRVHGASGRPSAGPARVARSRRGRTPPARPRPGQTACIAPAHSTCTARPGDMARDRGYEPGLAGMLALAEAWVHLFPSQWRPRFMAQAGDAPDPRADGGRLDRLFDLRPLPRILYRLLNRGFRRSEILRSTSTAIDDRFPCPRGGGGGRTPYRQAQVTWDRKLDGRWRW
jgi:hypothetical protein